MNPNKIWTVVSVIATALIGAFLFGRATTSQPTRVLPNTIQDIENYESPYRATTQEILKCSIKGNISYNTGERIYHIPGCPNYYDTVITTTKGERYFCTEREAVAAGWRKARNCPY